MGGNKSRAVAIAAAATTAFLIQVAHCSVTFGQSGITRI